MLKQIRALNVHFIYGKYKNDDDDNVVVVVACHVPCQEQQVLCPINKII